MPTVDFATGFECRATGQLGDGFGECSTIGSQGIGSVQTTNHRSGARCWQGGDAFGSNWFRRRLPNRATRVIAGVFRPTSLTDCLLFGMADGTVENFGANGQINVRLNADGTLDVYRAGSSWWGNAGTLLGTTTNAIATVNAYHHLELVATINNTTGSVDLYVDLDPTPWLSLSGINTRSTSNNWSDCIGISGGPGGGSGFRWDDVYTADSRMSFPDQRILPLNVEAGNGALTGSTPSTGTDRGAMVDETTSDDDTTYNAFDTGEEDSYTTPTLGSTGTIRYFIMWQRWKKNDFGGVGVRGGVRISGTNYYGTERFIGTAAYENVLGYAANVSPATAVAFTEAEINAMELVADRNT